METERMHRFQYIQYRYITYNCCLQGNRKNALTPLNIAMAMLAGIESYTKL